MLGDWLKVDEMMLMFSWEVQSEALETPQEPGIQTFLPMKCSIRIQTPYLDLY
jgi:hypothetical protein